MELGYCFSDVGSIESVDDRSDPLVSKRSLFLDVGQFLFKDVRPETQAQSFH